LTWGIIQLKEIDELMLIAAAYDLNSMQMLVQEKQIKEEILTTSINELGKILLNS